MDFSVATSRCRVVRSPEWEVRVVSIAEMVAVCEAMVSAIFWRDALIGAMAVFREVVSCYIVEYFLEFTDEHVQC